MVQTHSSTLVLSHMYSALNPSLYLEGTREATYTIWVLVNMCTSKFDGWPQRWSGLKHWFCRRRLWQLGLFSPKEGWLWDT